MKNRPEKERGDHLCVSIPCGLASVFQQLLQAGEVVPAHSSGRVLPFPQDLGPDQLCRPFFTLLQVTQHVAYKHTEKVDEIKSELVY